MEFLEYYRIIRDRVWIVVLTASVAVVIVGVMSVLPPSEYTARGRILVHGEASLIMRRTGDRVGPESLRDFWYTLFQVLGSDMVLYRSAQQAGITDPRVVENLDPVQGRQESRSSVARITASAPKSDQAEDLTNTAMEVLREQWDAFRLNHIEQIEADLKTVLSQTEENLKPVEQRMEGYRTTERPGVPPDWLNSLEARISSLEGQIQGAEIEVELGQDRIESLRALQRGESALPLGAQEYGGVVAGELRTLHQELDDRRDELAAMLEYRTEEHPAVEALKNHIAELEEDIDAVRSGETPTTGVPSPLEAQVIDAELALQDARHRIQVLQAQALELRAQLPAYRAQAREYAEIANEYAKLTGERDAILAELDELDAERRRLQETDDIEVLDEAMVLPTGRTVGKTILLFFAGIMGGGIIGVLAILVLHYVDVTFKNAYEAARLSRRRVLVAIPRTDIVFEPIEPQSAEPAEDESGPPEEPEEDEG